MGKIRSLLDLIALLITSTPYLLVLLIHYRVKRARARRAALSAFRELDLDESASRKLIDIVIPNLEEILEWMNLRRLKSY